MLKEDMARILNSNIQVNDLANLFRMTTTQHTNKYCHYFIPILSSFGLPCADMLFAQSE